MASDALVSVSAFTLSTLNDAMQAPAVAGAAAALRARHSVRDVAGLRHHAIARRGLALAGGGRKSSVSAIGRLLPAPSHCFSLQSPEHLHRVHCARGGQGDIAEAGGADLVCTGGVGAAGAGDRGDALDARAGAVALRGVEGTGAGGSLGERRVRGDAAVHTLCRHMLLVGGLSLSSLATTTPPVASQTFCLQSPRRLRRYDRALVGEGDTAGAAVADGVWHSLAGRPQSASTMQPTHTPVALHIWLAPQGVPSGRTGFVGLPFEQSVVGAHVAVDVDIVVVVDRPGRAAHADGRLAVARGLILTRERRPVRLVGAAARPAALQLKVLQKVVGAAVGGSQARHAGAVAVALDAAALAARHARVLGAGSTGCRCCTRSACRRWCRRAGRCC